MARKKKKDDKINGEWPPPMKEDELKDFVLGVVDRRIFTSAHIPEGKENMIEKIFMPVGLGAFSKVQRRYLKNIGVIWEWMKSALPLGFNGMPIFTSARCMNRADWARAKEAIEAEEKRRKELKI